MKKNTPKLVKATWFAMVFKDGDAKTLPDIFYSEKSAKRAKVTYDAFWRGHKDCCAKEVVIVPCTITYSVPQRFKKTGV